MLVGMVSIYLPCIVTFAQLLHFWCGIMDAIWDPVHLLQPSKAKKKKGRILLVGTKYLYGILLHSGLDSAWHFWLSAGLSFVWKWNKFFEIVRVNTSKCSKQFYFEATENQASYNCLAKSGQYGTGCFLVFWVIFCIKMRLKYEKE